MPSCLDGLTPCLSANIVKCIGCYPYLIVKDLSEVFTRVII